MTSEDQLSLAETISASVVTGLKTVLQPLVATKPAEGNAAQTGHVETKVEEDPILKELNGMLIDTLKNPPPNKIIKGRKTVTYVNGADERIKQIQDLISDRVNYRASGQRLR